MFQGVWTAGLTWTSRVDRNSQRHKTDYEVLEELGRGGFGMVYRVKHRLDGQEYAMKVVRASSSTTEMQKILREVHVLSSIRSDHVVRYYSAWMERGDLAGNESDDDDDDDGNTSRDDEPTQSFTTMRRCSSRDISSTSSSLQQVSYPTCHLCQSTYKDWEVTLEHWGLIDTVLQPLNLCIDCYKKSIPPDVDISNISIRETKVLPECLYILMEYCESTLNDVTTLCRRDNQIDEPMIWSLFGQILEGFAHLHANGIIHRDVKPSNIFVHNNVVKIGDLGLATTTTFSTTIELNNRDSGSPPQSSQTSLNPKSSDVGTVLYAAPEVRNSRYYDEKADVYSLGIVLVEMFHFFSTGMERVMILSDVRQGIFPDTWAQDYPYALGLARRMLQAESPESRPSCFEILQELQSKGLCQENSTKHLVTNLQSQIHTLQETVEIQCQEIERLRLLLETNNISVE